MPFPVESNLLPTELQKLLVSNHVEYSHLPSKDFSGLMTSASHLSATVVTRGTADRSKPGVFQLPSVPGPKIKQ
eukprot:7491076-Karenia_brevis.AAC.1